MIIEVTESAGGISGSHFLISDPKRAQKPALAKVAMMPRLNSILPISFPPTIVRVTPPMVIAIPIRKRIFLRVFFFF